LKLYPLPLLQEPFPLYPGEELEGASPDSKSSLPHLVLKYLFIFHFLYSKVKKERFIVFFFLIHSFTIPNLYKYILTTQIKWAINF